MKRDPVREDANYYESYIESFRVASINVLCIRRIQEERDRNHSHWRPIICHCPRRLFSACNRSIELRCVAIIGAYSTKHRYLMGWRSVHLLHLSNNIQMLLPHVFCYAVK